MSATLTAPKAQPATGMSHRLVAGGGGRWALFYSRRSLVVTVVMLLAVAALLIVELALGDYFIAPGDVIATLQGHGTRVQDFIIYDIRLPRALTALLVGAALGLSGAIFQSLTRNALGSPDVIGFVEGASLGAVISILVLRGDQLQVVVGAMVGGLIVAAVVYFLSYKRGVQSHRLILVGIGVSVLLAASVEYLLLKADIVEAQRALVWLTGSLNDRGWEHVVGVGLGLLVLMPLCLLFARRLTYLEMGDDLASALGVPVESSRRWLLFLGTATTAIAVAAAGPIAFIALAAPQVARRLSGRQTVALVPAAAMGAFLLLASDLVAQWAMHPLQLPVGVATLVVGGVYLAVLLFFENRAGRD